MLHTSHYTENLKKCHRLTFIYTGEVSETEDDCVAERFKIADKFKIAKMKAAYENVLIENIEDDNVLAKFVFADKIGAEKLKEAAFTAIQNMFTEVELPVELIKHPDVVKKLMANRIEHEQLKEDIKSLE